MICYTDMLSNGRFIHRNTFITLSKYFSIRDKTNRNSVRMYIICMHMYLLKKYMFFCSSRKSTFT